MLGLEEIMVELGDMNNEQGLPPGFRFHPTDEELINFYLASKVLNGSFCGLNIPEVDLNRCEPWELPEGAKMGEREWYFYSLRDRKYPTGLRTNRATSAGYWKATGKDREIYTTQSPSGGGHGGGLVGTKKTLVFYKGRAPRGEKTKWVMHEYRLHSNFFLRHSCKEEWAICRILHKLGEKKNNMVLQGGCFLPPLVEEAFLINQQDNSYLKSLISHPVSLPPRSTAINETANKEEYYCTSKRVTNATISKVYKTEGEEVMSSFLPFCQLSNHDLPCLHNTPPLTTSSFWADFMGFTSAATDTMPMTSAPVGFQIADSWPLL